MPRYSVEVKRQEPGSNLTIGGRINVEADNEINARFAAEGIARARWPKCTIMICQVKKQ